MSDIKSLGHQAIHSTQTAQGEAAPKTSDIAKENKPAEFRPLTNEQKESIKHSRAAESKFAEAAIKRDFFDEWGSTKAGAAEDPKSSLGASQHVNSHFHKTKLAEVRNGKGNENAGGGGAGSTNDLVKGAEPKNIVKSGPELMPIGTGSRGDAPGLDDLKKVAKVVDKVITGSVMPQAKLDGEESGVPMYKEEKVKKAEKFVPSIRLYAQPILDGEDEREEENITVMATEPKPQKE